MELFWALVAMAIALFLLATPVLAGVWAWVVRSRLVRLGTALEQQTAELAGLRQRLAEVERRLGTSGALEGESPLQAAPRAPSEARPAAPSVPPAVGEGAVGPIPATDAAPGPAPADEGEVREAKAAAMPPPQVRPGADRAASESGPPPPPQREAAPPAPEPGLEERLGARLPIWIGAVALALAGVFLVRYSVERGWLSPPVRLALALLFGGALLGFGEWMRPRSAKISQALSAAGIADLYASLLAGVRLYGLIPPFVGFGLMVANTAVAVGLSLRQGPMIALLGLVGGFATPALVSTGEGNVVGLVSYLFLLELGLVATSRKRRWPWLALGALVAALFWVAAWLGGLYRPGDSVALGIFLLATAFLFAGQAQGMDRDRRARAGDWTIPLTYLAVGAGLFLLARVVGASGYGAAEWSLFALLVAGGYALAILRPEFFSLAPLGAAVTFLLLSVRGASVSGAESESFLLLLALFGLGQATASWAALWVSPRPARWAALAATVLLAFPALGYLVTRKELELPWAGIALALAGLALALAVPVARRRSKLVEGEAALGALAVAVTLHVSWALPLALESAWLSVAFALEALLLVELRRRLRVPALAHLALGAAALAAARLLLNPGVLEYPAGGLPLANWVLWGYGVPLLASLGAASLVRKDGREGEAEFFEALASAYAFALVTLETWHLFRPGDRLAPPSGEWGVVEWGTQAVVWLVLGLGLVAAGSRLERRIFSASGRLVVAVAGAQVLLVHCLSRNPAWTHHPVGELPILNGLLVYYVVPAALLVLSARRVELEGGRKLPGAARLVALLAGFAWATLSVRQLFRGTWLDGGRASNAEQFGYSAVWLLFGIGLLVAGVAGRSRPMRLAALAVMLVAVLKVFLYDTRQLEDLYRVFSFLGLGASLLLLAWLYQRFVFRTEDRSGG